MRICQKSNRVTDEVLISGIAVCAYMDKAGIGVAELRKRIEKGLQESASKEEPISKRTIQECRKERKKYVSMRTANHLAIGLEASINDLKYRKKRLFAKGFVLGALAAVAFCLVLSFAMKIRNEKHELLYTKRYWDQILQASRARDEGDPELSMRLVYDFCQGIESQFSAHNYTPEIAFMLACGYDLQSILHSEAGERQNAIQSLQRGVNLLKSITPEWCPKNLAPFMGGYNTHAAAIHNCDLRIDLASEKRKASIDAGERVNVAALGRDLDEVEKILSKEIARNSSRFATADTCFRLSREFEDLSVVPEISSAQAEFFRSRALFFIVRGLDLLSKSPKDRSVKLSYEICENARRCLIHCAQGNLDFARESLEELSRTSQGVSGSFAIDTDTAVNLTSGIAECKTAIAILARDKGDLEMSRRFLEEAMIDLGKCGLCVRCSYQRALAAAFCWKLDEGCDELHSDAIEAMKDFVNTWEKGGVKTSFETPNIPGELVELIKNSEELNELVESYPSIELSDGDGYPLNILPMSVGNSPIYFEGELRDE